MSLILIGSVLQTLFFGGEKRQPEIRLRSQAVFVCLIAQSDWLPVS